MKKTVFAALALLLGIGTMAYAGLQLTESRQVYQQGNEAYEMLSAHVRQNAAAGSHTPRNNNEIVNIPNHEIDFEALETVSGDAAAWLYSPGTVIDYPVMKADDYSYYLYRLPDGTENANGSLFIDYNTASDFSDPLTVIYGHHMKSGRMFGSLVGYKAQSYYNQHPNMYLYTQQETYKIELLYGFVIDAGQWRRQAFMYPENVEALLAHAAYNTTFESEVVYKEGDRIVALSTCSYEFDEARYVVLGILRG